MGADSGRTGSMLFRGMKQALKGRFRLPLHIILHVTYRCGGRCQTCFNWRNLNAGKTEMSLTEFENLSRGLGELIWLHISGGEPFLRDDLPDICEIFARNNRPSFISIPTAGLEPERVEKIGEEILRRIRTPIAIDIALDDLGSRHDEIRGVVGSFDNLLKTFEGLRRLTERFEHLSTKVTTVLTNENFGNLEKIIDFVYYKMKGVGFHTIIFIRGEPRNPSLRLPPLEKLIEKRSLLFDTWERYDYDRNLPWANRIIANAAHTLLFDLYLKMMRENRRCIPCLAGKAHAVVGADGNVFFCELFERLGNIRDCAFDFNKLWNSSRADEMRRFIEARHCWCTHGCVHMDNLAFNVKRYPSLMRSASIELLKRLGKQVKASSRSGHPI